MVSYIITWWYNPRAVWSTTATRTMRRSILRPICGQFPNVLSIGEKVEQNDRLKHTRGVRSLPAEGIFTHVYS